MLLRTFYGHSYIDSNRRLKIGKTVQSGMLYWNFFPKYIVFLAFGAAEQAIQIIKIQQFCRFF